MQQDALRHTTDKFGNQIWHNKKGQFHREDGPAFLSKNGIQTWWINGDRHRIDGPAFIGIDGTQEWWVSYNRYYDNKSFQQATNLSDEDMIAMILKYGNVG
jgi:hypothetical protein